MPILRLGCGAAAAFVGFLLFVLTLSEGWPGFERSRWFGWVFTPVFLALIAVELSCFGRISALLAHARFYRAHNGTIFILGTTRKDWYPLLDALREGLPAQYRFVWWRGRSASPLQFLALRCPPADLPCALLVRDGSWVAHPLGHALRPFRSRPLQERLDAALDTVVRAASPPHSGLSTQSASLNSA